MKLLRIIAATALGVSGLAQASTTVSCTSPQGASVALVAASDASDATLKVENAGQTLLDAKVSVAAFEDSTVYTTDVDGKASVSVSVYNDGSATGTLLLAGQPYELTCNAVQM